MTTSGTIEPSQDNRGTARLINSSASKEVEEVVARLRLIAQSKFEQNRSFGRRGKQWAIDAEIEWTAADLLTRLSAERDRLERELAKALAKPKEKRAPVQGWPESIPWDMHLRAYAAYSKRSSPQPALLDLEGRNCRGGFGTEELDMFIPGWREELSERAALKTRAERAEAERDALKSPPEDVLERMANTFAHHLRLSTGSYRRRDLVPAMRSALAAAEGRTEPQSIPTAYGDEA